jgi:hypothetical protein
MTSSRQSSAADMGAAVLRQGDEGPPEHAGRLGLEGIVSKRKGSRYSSGRSPHWLKSKNLNAPAARREAEEDWGDRKGVDFGNH